MKIKLTILIHICLIPNLFYNNIFANNELASLQTYNVIQNQPSQNQDFYEFFIRLQYKDFFSREPSDGEINYYHDNLKKGNLSLEQFISAILDSEENKNNLGFLIRCYLFLLNKNSDAKIDLSKLRIPDYKGISYYLEQMNKNKTDLTQKKKDVIQQLMGSMEFTRLIGNKDNNPEFVSFILKNYVGKEPDKNEIENISKQITDGIITRSDLALKFIDSEKIIKTFENYCNVIICYIGFQKRTPGRSEFIYHLTNPDNNKDKFLIIRSFLNSPEYITRIEEYGYDLLNGKNFELVLPDGIKIEFVKINGGSFLMGSDDMNWSIYNERPPHKVNINYYFYISKHEITQEQWIAIMGNSDEYYDKTKNNFPITNVSWYECQDYIERINQMNQGVYSLPSEAEWEFACRGGQVKEFYFGDSDCKIGECKSCNLDKYAWWCGNNQEFGKKEVGKKSPNSLGIYDMIGNVYEWCRDEWHDNYKDAPRDGSAWIDGKSVYRVIRGGYWFSSVEHCRSSSRNCFSLNKKAEHIGFRLIRKIYPKNF